MSTSTLKKFIFLGLATLGLASIAPFALAQSDLSKIDNIHFKLHVNPKFVSCLGKDGQTPTANVTVTRGTRKDTLVLKAKNLKPGLAFDMFTVQRSSLLADGSPDPNFTNFGFAWYQSDVQADSDGNAVATIKTILLDQIFGFDPDLSNPNPVNTFHVGFWFNNPNDANVDGCVFDVTHPTPFNGEHNAGPVAMISVPDATTGLGPLCTDPDGKGGCNP